MCSNSYLITRRELLLNIFQLITIHTISYDSELYIFSMAFPAHSGPWRLIQFRNHFSQTVGFLERVISFSQGSYLNVVFCVWWYPPLIRRVLVRMTGCVSSLVTHTLLFALTNKPHSALADLRTSAIHRCTRTRIFCLH
jgi:hypothetical protein